MELIHSNLSKLGYNCDVSEKDFAEGTLNLIFVDVITWLSSQLVSFYQLESYVNPVRNEEDTLGFFVEVSSLLKELYCPYKSLIKGKIIDRLFAAEDKKLLVLYLCTELESAKIQACKKLKTERVFSKIELNESKTALELKEMLLFLHFPKPPETITPQILFGEVEKRLKQLSHRLTPRAKVGELIFSGVLWEKQWFQLESLFHEMSKEYKTRRNLLLTRLDVTVKSFLWADRLKTKTEEIMDIYNKMKSNIALEPSVKISQVLASKSDLSVIEKNSAPGLKNTKPFVYGVVIGDVPDRGGRPEEQQPPPPEVPSWQKNSIKDGARQYNPRNTRSSHSRGNIGYSRDSNSFRDNTGYSRHITGYKSSCNPRSSADTHGENISPRNTKKYNRNDYNNSHPVYQPATYCPQIGHPQFGFGGYISAGANFQNYGMPEGMNQINPIYQGEGGSRVLRSRGRGEFDRGFDQYRGRQDRRGYKSGY